VAPSNSFEGVFEVLTSDAPSNQYVSSLAADPIHLSLGERPPAAALAKAGG